MLTYRERRGHCSKIVFASKKHLREPFDAKNAIDAAHIQLYTEAYMTLDQLKVGKSAVITAVG